MELSGQLPDGATTTNAGSLDIVQEDSSAMNSQMNKSRNLKKYIVQTIRMEMINSVKHFTITSRMMQ